jgi:hypothetical protein
MPMTFWRLQRGSTTVATVRTGGVVEGPDGEVKVELEAIASGGARMRVGPPPGAFAVDPGSDWTVDRFVREMADLFGLDVVTDYSAREEDAPAEVRTYLDACRSRARLGGSPGVVF